MRPLALSGKPEPNSASPLYGSPVPGVIDPSAGLTCGAFFGIEQRRHETSTCCRADCRTAECSCSGLPSPRSSRAGHFPVVLEIRIDLVEASPIVGVGAGLGVVLEIPQQHVADHVPRGQPGADVAKDTAPWSLKRMFSSVRLRVMWTPIFSECEPQTLLKSSRH